MMKFKDTALILAGHGSTKNAQSSRHTRETAKRLQKRGIFKEVRAGFWKESPSFQEVFHGLEAKKAIVVPWFLTRGYFVEKVLAEKFASTPIPVRILDPIGARPEIVDLVRARAERLFAAQFKFKFKLKLKLKRGWGLEGSQPFFPAAVKAAPHGFEMRVGSFGGLKAAPHHFQFKVM